MSEDGYNEFLSVLAAIPSKDVQKNVMDTNDDIELGHHNGGSPSSSSVNIIASSSSPGHDGIFKKSFSGITHPNSGSSSSDEGSNPSDKKDNLGNDSSITSTHSSSNENDSNHKDHNHHHEQPSLLSKAASAIVCFIIYFVFCIVFSSVVWDPLNSAADTSIDPPFGIPQGVGINLMGIVVGSVFFAWRSGCSAVMAGPDLLPVVFFAEAGLSVVTYLAANSKLVNINCNEHQDMTAGYEYDGSSNDPFHRSLNGMGSNFYDGPVPSVIDNTVLCNEDNDEYHHRHLGGNNDLGNIDASLIAQVVPTTLVAMMIGNAVTALLFYGLGKMKNTASVIGFIPASVVAGFLTCIGYKVIKLAVLITTGYAFKEKYIKNLGKDYDHINDPWLPLTIAIIYGCALYGLKRAHVIPAEKLILAFIAVPIVVFFAIVGITGTSMQELREDDWFLTQVRDGKGCVKACAFTRINFWQTLEIAYGGIFSNLVAWGAIPRCIPIFIMGSVMTSLDNMLKLTSSEKALGVDLDYNHEMKLGGKASLIAALLAGAPAYGQTKFNVMNLSIARTSQSSLPTLLLGGISALVFLSGIAGPLTNIMPRFLLGGLCVFAGVGFLYENLWEGRKKMNRVSFAIVWIIFLVNFIWEFFFLQTLPKDIQPMVPGLLIVFVLGIVLSTFEFMFAFMRKAQSPSIRGGDVCCSTAIRSEKHDRQLAVMSPWFQVFSIDSFIFFGTANNMYSLLKQHIAAQQLKPKSERTKYLIFDLSAVTGIDSSAKSVFYKVHRLLSQQCIKLIWAFSQSKMIKKFDDWGLYAGNVERYDSLDVALRHVEDELLQRASRLSSRWLVNSTVRKIYERQVLANVFSISVRSDEKTFSTARLMPWAQKLTITAGEELCGPDDTNLYMLYDGEVSVKLRDGSQMSFFKGSFFNLDQLLISVGALPGIPSTKSAMASTDTLLLVLSQANFLSMQQHDPALCQKLLLTLLVQNESFRPGRVRTTARMRETLTGDLCVDKSFRTVSTFKLNCNSEEWSVNATRLLAGDDYKIELTNAQVERFSKLFDMIGSAGADEIDMEVFSNFVSVEARALGSTIEHEQFMALIDASGIDEDGDGVLSKDEFLSFLRGLFLADIPSSEVAALRQAYDATVAKNPGSTMDESKTLELFASLGFDTKSAATGDVMRVIDADGDGDVSFDEFMTGIGMMKQHCMMAKQLNKSFGLYKQEATRERRSSEFSSNSAAAPQNRVSRMGPRMKSVFGSFTGGNQKEIQLAVAQDEEDKDLELNASDLEAFLQISREEAEEMVFLADQDESEVRTIDREEFIQLIRTWS